MVVPIFKRAIPRIEIYCALSLRNGEVSQGAHHPGTQNQDPTKWKGQIQYDMGIEVTEDEGVLYLNLAHHGRTAILTAYGKVAADQWSRTTPVSMSVNALPNGLVAKKAEIARDPSRFKSFLEELCGEEINARFGKIHTVYVNGPSGLKKYSHD